MSVSRQLLASSFSPLKSITRAPTRKASGARYLRVLLRRTTAASTDCSSPSRIAAMRWRICPPIRFRRARRADLPEPSATLGVIQDSRRWGHTADCPADAGLLATWGIGEPRFTGALS
jgi:hypothetical protein